MSTTTPKPAVVCVFCGSSSGTSPAHLSGARALAHALHATNTTLVYGGGTVGLMGELARTLVSLSGAGSVHGIIPASLVRLEAGFAAGADVHSAIDEAVYGRTTVVRDMHTRKAQMAREVAAGGPGSGFVAMSGGYGTLEELMEVTTWNQLGIHDKGVVVYNVEGYWDGLLKWVREAVGAGFISEGNSGILVEATTAEDVVARLRDYKNAEGRYNLTWGEE